MKNRIKKIRKELGEQGKSQESFALYLGIPKTNITSYEIGRRTPSESVIKLICEKCDVNEEWLRTGEGEMRPKRTRNQELTDFVNTTMELTDEDFKKRFLSALSKLNERDWETIKKIAESLSEEG